MADYEQLWQDEMAICACGSFSALAVDMPTAPTRVGADGTETGLSKYCLHFKTVLVFRNGGDRRSTIAFGSTHALFVIHLSLALSCFYARTRA